MEEAVDAEVRRRLEEPKGRVTTPLKAHREQPETQALLLEKEPMYRGMLDELLARAAR